MKKEMKKIALTLAAFLSFGTLVQAQSNYNGFVNLSDIETKLALEDKNVDFQLPSNATSLMGSYKYDENVLLNGNVILDTWGGITAAPGYDFGATFAATIKVDENYKEDTLKLYVCVPVSEGYAPGLSKIDLNEQTYKASGSSDNRACFDNIPFTKGQDNTYRFTGFINFKHPVKFEKQQIETVYLKNVNLNLTEGTLPTFSGQSEKPDLYTLKGDTYEMWTDVETGEYFTSSKFYNRDNLIEKLIAGRKYSYSVMLNNVSPNNDEYLISDFSTIKNVSINGKEYALKEENIYFDEEFGWVVNLNNILEVTVGYNLKTADDASTKVSINSEKPFPSGTTLSTKEATDITETIKKSETNLKKVFDISAYVGTNVYEVTNTSMTITLDLDSELTGFDVYKVVYIKDGKIVEELPATITNGQLMFQTNHLSYYGVVAYNEDNVNPTPSTPNPNTFDAINIYYIVAIVAAIGITSFIIYRKKHNN